LLGILVVAAVPDAARATMRLDQLGAGRLELSGNVQSQNILRHESADNNWQFIQNRNVFRARLDWEAVQGSQLMGKWRMPGIRKAKVFMLYRFAYDSIYDFTPDTIPARDFRRTDTRALFGAGGKQNAGPDGIEPAGIPQRARTLDGVPRGELDAYKFDNQIREAYVDLAFRRVPLSLRVGRQQVVWGETDNFRMLDRVNSLDLSWHFFHEVPPPAFGWDEIRRPFFLVKGLYNLGALGPLSQSFFEVYWNPGDWHPVKHAFLPRPWGLQIYDPLENRADGAFRYAPCNISEVAINPDTGDGMCTRLMKGTRLFQRGDYDHFDAVDNSQVGARFHALTPQGIEFTLNYFWQRWAGDDGTNSAPLRGLRLATREAPGSDPNSEAPPDPNSIEAERLLRRGIFPAEFYTPYVHTVGFSANYSDEQFTQTVYRLETILDFGVPFFDRGVQSAGLDDRLPGVRHMNMWKGMIGFDRLQWIRFLNRKSTFFITGQLFWHYLIDNPECPDVVGSRFGRNGRSCLTGATDLPSAFRTTVNQDTGEQIVLRDKIRDWESLFTLATFTFYRGGSVVPVAGVAVDYVNHWSSLAFWSLDYFLTPNLAVNLTQRYFLNPTGEEGPILATWGLADLNRNRSETALRLTYNF
jgi:hypothetical protein